LISTMWKMEQDGKTLILILLL